MALSLLPAAQLWDHSFLQLSSKDARQISAALKHTDSRHTQGRQRSASSKESVQPRGQTLSDWCCNQVGSPGCEMWSMQKLLPPASFPPHCKGWRQQVPGCRAQCSPFCLTFSHHLSGEISASCLWRGDGGSSTALAYSNGIRMPGARDQCLNAWGQCPLWGHWFSLKTPTMGKTNTDLETGWPE